MKSSQPSRPRSGFLAMAGLFVPRTWSPWFLFLVPILLIVATSVPHQFTWIPVVLAVILLVRVLLVAAVRCNFGPALALIAGMVASALLEYSLLFLAAGGQALFLAAGGQATSSKAPGAPLDVARLVSVLVTMWLLLGVPNQAHKIRLNKDGHAQRFLVGVITAAACVMTATYLVLMHFSPGSLSNVARGPLVAGIVFTTVLVAPIYSSLARATWQRGLPGIFSPTPLKESWRKTAKEVRTALDQAAKDKTTPVTM
jgi:hypothetical protein